MKGSWRRRCDARTKHTAARKAGKLRGISWRCRKWAVPGKTRCFLHGGKSTGPRTPEGKARTLAAMLEGRRRRIAELALEGKKINGGHNGGRPRKDGQPVHRKQTRERILEELAAMAAPALTPEQEAMVRRIVADSDRVALEKEIAERRRLRNLVLRGSSENLRALGRGRPRDEALIARAREAAAELQRRMRGRE
jgi:hypothetical protein